MRGLVRPDEVTLLCPAQEVFDTVPVGPDRLRRPVQHALPIEESIGVDGQRQPVLVEALRHRVLPAALLRRADPQNADRLISSFACHGVSSFVYGYGRPFLRASRCAIPSGRQVDYKLRFFNDLNLSGGLPTPPDRWPIFPTGCLSYS